MNQAMLPNSEMSISSALSLMSFEGVSVLIVDDLIENQIVVGAVLENHGAHITFAANGKEAVEIASLKNFDLIVMDMQMPIMDGFKASRALRQNGFIGLIIAFTADVRKSTEAQCLAAGCDFFLNKPINPLDFLSTIAWLLKQRLG